jgi:ABC-type oligopeptide transport system substrate-binding subunit
VSDAQQVLRVNEHGPKQGDLTTLDPQLLYYQAEYQIATEIFVGLLTLKQDGHMTGDGATHWTISAGGLTYGRHMRFGLAWADGIPITARDVADAIARSQEPFIRKGRASGVNSCLGGEVNALLVGAHAEEALTCPKHADGTLQMRLAASRSEGSGQAIEAVVVHRLVLRLSPPAPSFLAALTYTTADPVAERVVHSGGSS